MLSIATGEPSRALSSVPRNFIPGRNGIQVQSQDPGIFRDGISLIFSSRDFLEIVRDFSGLTFLMELGNESKSPVTEKFR